MLDPLAALYDKIPYPGFVHTVTHPRALAAVARLFGQPSAWRTAPRVLELGCNDGTNLRSIAASLPDAECLGVELRAEPVAVARAATGAQGLNNIRFKQADIGELDLGTKRFDVIIAHGVLSWLPPELQPQVFAICGKHLADDGVASICYHAQPGYAAQDAIRQLYTLELAEAGAPLSRAENLAAFQRVATTLRKAGAELPAERAHLKLLQLALSRMEGKPHVLPHDEGAEFCDGFYLLEVAQMASANGLAYLNDALIARDWIDRYPPGIRQVLIDRRMPRLKALQYADYLFNTHFRHSLFVRNEKLPTIPGAPDLRSLPQLSLLPTAREISAETALSPSLVDALNRQRLRSPSEPLPVQVLAASLKEELSAERLAHEIIHAHATRVATLWDQAD